MLSSVWAATEQLRLASARGEKSNPKGHTITGYSEQRRMPRHLLCWISLNPSRRRTNPIQEQKRKKLG